MARIMTAEQAAELITNSSTIAMLGNGGATLEPRLVYRRIGERFERTGSPQNLTLIHSAGIGDRDTEGLNRFAHPGMTKRVIGGHWAWSPTMQAMANANQIEAYNLPQGVITQQYREIAAKRPGLIAKTGLGTFVDPRLDGGKLNAAATEDLVSLITLDDEEWLHYKPWHLDFGIIRATTADPDGNLTFEDEVCLLEATAIAQAVHNCGGTVIAQVHYLAEAGSLRPKDVRVPGVLVDVVVVDDNQWQTAESAYDPALAGAPSDTVSVIEPMPMSHRKIIARRAAMELRPGMVYNLGFGIPDGVASVAAEEGLTGITATIEQGLIGGVPARGDIFGAAYNPVAFVEAPSQFDFYAGGGLDLTCLGMAECDQDGNVNVSKFGPTIAGCGGFIDISQSARTVIFTGTFTAGGLRTSVQDGELVIDSEGAHRKFVEHTQHITFSGDYAKRKGQRVLYVTERAVFRLADELELIEIAPGVDLESQVLALMGFSPKISDDLRLMDERIFRDEPMGIAATLNKGES